MIPESNGVVKLSPKPTSLHLVLVVAILLGFLFLVFLLFHSSACPPLPPRQPCVSTLSTSIRSHPPLLSFFSSRIYPSIELSLFLQSRAKKLVHFSEAYV